MPNQWACEISWQDRIVLIKIEECLPIRCKKRLQPKPKIDGCGHARNFKSRFCTAYRSHFHSAYTMLLWIFKWKNNVFHKKKRKDYSKISYGKMLKRSKSYNFSRQTDWVYLLYGQLRERQTCRVGQWESTFWKSSLCCGFFYRKLEV